MVMAPVAAAPSLAPTGRRRRCCWLATQTSCTTGEFTRQAGRQPCQGGLAHEVPCCAGNCTGPPPEALVPLCCQLTAALPSRLLDQWASVDKSRPILIPSVECGRLPRDYCPVPVELYGLRSTSGGGCTLDRWLVPNGCLLPPPYPVLVPLLGRWERQSQTLAVGEQARRAFQEFLPYFQGEMGRVGDSSLGQEVDILKRLIAV